MLVIVIVLSVLAIALSLFAIFRPTETKDDNQILIEMLRLDLETAQRVDSKRITEIDKRLNRLSVPLLGSERFLDYLRKELRFQRRWMSYVNRRLAIGLSRNSPFKNKNASYKTRRSRIRKRNRRADL